MRRLALVILVLAAGCLADTGDEAFLIRNNLVPSAQTCAFLPAIGAPGISRGTLEMGHPVATASSSYVLSPLIESRVTATIGQESQRTIFVEGARVDLELGSILLENDQGARAVMFTDAELAQLAAPDVALTKFKSLFSAPIDPNGGLTAATFDIVPSALVTVIRNKVSADLSADLTLHASSQVVAHITLFGKLGGEEIESLPFVYPVTVCSGCVMNFLGACPQKAVMPGDFANSCNQFQDGYTECCKTANGDLACPTIEPSM